MGKHFFFPTECPMQLIPSPGAGAPPKAIWKLQCALIRGYAINVMNMEHARLKIRRSQ